MPNKPESILIVDDQNDLRSTLAYLFSACGFNVREASDGFGALDAIKKEMPDILISDLMMPNMCGYELLSIVRRRFPSIGVVAMSGSYSGDTVPDAVAADAFYAKGATSTGALFGIVNTLIEECESHRCRAEAPIWIPQIRVKNYPQDPHLVWCPECLRMFSGRVDSDTRVPNSAHCPHCSSDIQLALLTH